MIPFYCFNNMAIGIVLCCYLYGAHFFQPFTRAYENLALGKSAWQLNPIRDDYHNEYSANRAVDGRKSDLSEFGGECTSSSFYKTTAMWWVDLGTQQSIHHILIQYATGNRVWGKENYRSKYFPGFSVYISPTTNKEDGVLCFRDTNYTRATIPNPVNITCYYHGRYVIYYNNRTHKPFPKWYSEYAYNDLCEVEVYGCRKVGQYGPACSIPCPQNCLLGRCHITSGECAGCVAGYKGKSCNEECEKDKYGFMCNQTCGSWLMNIKECCAVPKYTFQIKRCDWGTYGFNCSQTCQRVCSTGAGSCDAVTGSCLGIQGPDDDRGDNSALIAGLLVAVLIVVAVIVFVVVFRRKRLQKQQNSRNEIDGQDTREKVSYRRTDILNNADITNVSESLACVDDEIILMPKPARIKLPVSQDTPNNSLNVKRYDVTDDCNDEEGVEYPYGDLYINYQATLDISINDLPKVIEEKKKKEADGFKTEYAVRRESYL